MKLLELTDELRARPHPMIAMLPAFTAVVERDSSKHRTEAVRELAYIYHLCSHESPYAAYEEGLRTTKVKEDLFGNPDWQEDKIVAAAREKFLELSESALIRLLKAAMSGIHRLTEFYQDVQIEESKDAKEFMMGLERLPKVIDGVQQLREQVEKEQAGDAKVRGGVALTRYNE